MVTISSVVAAVVTSATLSPPPSPMGQVGTTPLATATSTRGRPPGEASGGRGIKQASHPQGNGRLKTRLVNMAGVTMPSVALMVTVSGGAMICSVDAVTMFATADDVVGLTAADTIVPGMLLTIKRRRTVMAAVLSMAEGADTTRRMATAAVMSMVREVSLTMVGPPTAAAELRATASTSSSPAPSRALDGTEHPGHQGTPPGDLRMRRDGRRCALGNLG